MKSDSNILEIMLLTTTSFSKRQLCETNAEDRYKAKAPADQLEAACWNGLLDELLPEIMHLSSCSNKLFLWQVETEKYCLRLSMGDYPPVFEKRFALDPYSFLYKQEMN